MRLFSASLFSKTNGRALCVCVLCIYTQEQQTAAHKSFFKGRIGRTIHTVGLYSNVYYGSVVDKNALGAREEFFLQPKKWLREEAFWRHNKSACSLLYSDRVKARPVNKYIYLLRKKEREKERMMEENSPLSP